MRAALPNWLGGKQRLRQAGGEGRTLAACRPCLPAHLPTGASDRLDRRNTGRICRRKARLFGDDQGCVAVQHHEQTVRPYLGMNKAIAMARAQAQKLYRSSECQGQPDWIMLDGSSFRLGVAEREELGSNVLLVLQGSLGSTWSIRPRIGRRRMPLSAALRGVIDYFPETRLRCRREA